MPSADQLYELLPAVYRVRDAEPRQGEALKALLAVLGEQGDVVADDVERLYDNWFIETCDEWVVAYLGDLLGVTRLHPVSPAVASARAYVANAVRRRRRKGTAAVLEQLALDVTGWQARVVELFERLGTTQHANHPRLHSLRTPDLRHTTQLELLGGPFGRASHSAEVRRPQRGGRWNIPNLGVFLWRLAPFAVRQASARPVTSPPDGRFHVHPLGLDAPLFNPPRTETDISHLAEEPDVPGALRRRALYDELEARRQALADGAAPPPARWFGDNPVFELFVEQAGELTAVPPEELLICDLRDATPAPPGGWRRPPTTKAYEQATGGSVALPIAAAVDPVLGRVAFPLGASPARVEVSYVTAFSGEAGGGPYDRAGSVPSSLLERATFLRAVSTHAPPATDLVVATLAEAVQDWNAQPPGTVGVIAVTDSASYPEDLTGPGGIAVPAGSELLLVAAGWPAADTGEPAAGAAGVAQLVFAGVRPHLRGGLEVTGTAATPDGAPGRLVVNGLLVEGGIAVAPGDLGALELVHTTVAPPAAVIVSGDNDALEVTVERSLTGPLDLGDAAGVRVVDSVVDGAGGNALQAPEAAGTVEASTLLGVTGLRQLDAGNAIFDGTVTVLLRQQGCLRFSFVPGGSSTPRRFRCQPDLALERSGAQAEPERAAVRARLAPLFTSTDLADPGYAQLADACAEELRTGADDGAEMGAFHHLQQPQREQNLRTALDEYLPAGLEAGVFHVT